VSSAPQRPLVGTAALLLAALFWGLGFYAQRVSIENMTPLVATAARFLVALPFAVAALVWRARHGHPPPWRKGLVLGLMLYVVFALQTEAMLTAPVSRVALITGLYAVLTPLLQPFFGLGRPTAPQGIAAALAVAGTALLVGIVGGDTDVTTVPFAIGDVLTLAMAVVCAVLVLTIGRYAHDEDAIALNAAQTVVMATAGVVVAAVADVDAMGAMGRVFRLEDERALLSLLYLATFSTMGAFTLQIVGQRHVSPAPASIIMLLETPIGVISAVLLLGEFMSTLQWVGAGVALVAVVTSVAFERRTPPRPSST